MSFEAINSITEAEARARELVYQAEQKARQMVSDEENAGLAAVDAALDKAASELKELNRQADKKVRSDSESLSNDAENRKAVMRSHAEARLDKAASIVVERIVNS